MRTTGNGVNEIVRDEFIAGLLEPAAGTLPRRDSAEQFQEESSFVINGGVALSGAQPPEVFRSEIEQATGAGPVDACEPDSATGEGKC